MPAKLYVINKKTDYDIPHKLHKLAESIKSNDRYISDVLVAIRYKDKDGYYRTSGHMFGTDNGDTGIAMLECVKMNMLSK